MTLSARLPGPDDWGCLVALSAALCCLWAVLAPLL